MSTFAPNALPLTPGARIIPTVGLIGAPLLFAAFLAIFFGAIDQVSPISGIATLPVAVWEFSVGTWMRVKGFNPAAVAVLGTSTRPHA